MCVVHCISIFNKSRCGDLQREYFKGGGSIRRFHHCSAYSWARTPRILRAGGGIYYIKFVRYYNGIRRLGGGWFITRTPCVPRYEPTAFFLRRKKGSNTFAKTAMSKNLQFFALRKTSAKKCIVSKFCAFFPYSST